MTFNCRNIPLISTTVPSVKVKYLYFQNYDLTIPNGFDVPAFGHSATT